MRRSRRRPRLAPQDSYMVCTASSELRKVPDDGAHHPSIADQPGHRGTSCQGMEASHLLQSTNQPGALQERAEPSGTLSAQMCSVQLQDSTLPTSQRRLVPVAPLDSSSLLLTAVWTDSCMPVRSALGCCQRKK